MASSSPPDSDKPLYHLCEEKLWRATTASGQAYFPPTYHQDGFTHATSNPQLLLTVANHFYQDIQDNFLCLVIDPGLLKYEVKYEAAAAVGDKDTYQPDAGEEGPKFPHIYGPIEPSCVVQELKVHRNDKGEFLSIESV